MAIELVGTLIDCAASGHLERLKALKRDGGDLDQRDLRDRTALMCLADAGNAEGVRALLAAGADPNVRNHMGRTALMYAAYRKSEAVTKALLAGGAAVNVCDQQCRTALDYAFLNQKDSNACVQVLLAAGGRLGQRPHGLRRMVRNALAGDQFSDSAEFWSNVNNFLGGVILAVAVGWLPAFMARLVTYFFPFATISSPWSELLLGVSVIWVVAVVSVVVIPMFPAILRLGMRLVQRWRPQTAGAAKRGTSEVGPAPVDVRSPEFLCAILEDGAREVVRWKHRQQPGAALAQERLDGPLLLSIGVLMLTLLGIVLVALLGSYMLWARVGDADDLIGGLLFFLGLALLIPLTLEAQLRKYRLRRAQRRVDGLAANINQLLDQSSYSGAVPASRFAVYLRPFFSTNRLFFQGTDLETLLAYSFLPYMPIIALGRPGEHVGAGRIETSDATWKADITRMIEASEMALCVPSATEGTLWELDFLVKRDLLDKTVFIMPPATRHVNYAREWERVRQSPIQDVLALPPYVPEGVLFRARGGGGGGGVEVFAPLRLEQFLVQEMYVGGGSQSDDSSSRADESGDGESKSQEAAAASPVPTAAEIGVAAALFGASPDLEIAWTTEAAEVASFDAGDDSTDSDSTSADSGGGGGDSGGGGGDSGNG